MDPSSYPRSFPGVVLSSASFPSAEEERGAAARVRGFAQDKSMQGANLALFLIFFPDITKMSFV